MPIAHTELTPFFVGRDEYVARFKARLDHYKFFVYEGIPGIGKTSLIFRLLEEALAYGAEKIIHLRLQPSESIQSVVIRLEIKLNTAPSKGDAYTRLLEILRHQKNVIFLEGLHFLRTSELPTLIKILQAQELQSWVVGSFYGEFGLTPQQQTVLHHERISGHTRLDVQSIAEHFNIQGDDINKLMHDAHRGGASSHPLTLRYLLALRQDDLPPEDFFKRYSARSVTVFRALMDLWSQRFSEEDLTLLKSFARIGIPIDEKIASKAFGEKVEQFCQKGLLSKHQNEVWSHTLVNQYLGTEQTLTEHTVKIIAPHLKERALTQSEPVALIRSGELLASIGKTQEAIDTFAEGWDAIRDLNYLDSYLKAISSIPIQENLKSRLNVLATRARMHNATVKTNALKEMQELAKERDPWTQEHAFSALVELYSKQGDHAQALTAFEALQKVAPDSPVLVIAGSLAVLAMVRVERFTEAEKLAKILLSKLKLKTDAARMGELHRLLARIYSHGGKLTLAIEEAEAAAKCFEHIKDDYHAATAYGFIGDLEREAGNFDEAKKAFKEFFDKAKACGDKELQHVAELADAWIALDVGDLTLAAKEITEVERDIASVGPSLRLRRYLGAARALLDADRGKHEAAVSGFSQVIKSFNDANQQPIADYLEAEQIRSLIALQQLPEAERLIHQALKRLDEKKSPTRVALFIRELGFVRLHQHHAEALKLITQAKQLFAKHGNQREEVLTLYRLAKAALEIGDTKTAELRVDETLALAVKIKHPRAQALSKEILGRIALEKGNAHKAIALYKEALQALRHLGDELNALSVGDNLLRAFLVDNETIAVLKLGPKIKAEAERLEIREIRIRSVIFVGFALLKEQRLEAASKCFKDISDKTYSAFTCALMWRLGEALAVLQEDIKNRDKYHREWLTLLNKQHIDKKTALVSALEQLHLPPKEIHILRTAKKTENISSLRADLVSSEGYDVVIDLVRGVIQENKREVYLNTLDADDKQLLESLLLALGKPVVVKDAKNASKNIIKTLKPLKQLKLTLEATKLKLTPAKNYALLMPLWLTSDLSESQKRIVGFLQKSGKASLTQIQTQGKFEKKAVKQELDKLTKAKVVELLPTKHYRLA